MYLAKYFLHKIFDTIHKKSLHKHILPADSHYIITILSSEAVSYTHLDVYKRQDKEFTFYQRNGIIKNWTIYRTSDKDGENLLPVGSIKNHEKVVIPARSIITLVTQ